MFPPLRRRTCCFTGHRAMHPAVVDGVVRRTEEIVRRLIAGGVDRFCVGGAVGYDTLAAGLLFRLRDEESLAIAVTLFQPYPGFAAHWPDAADTALFEALYSRYDDVIDVSPAASRSVFHVRDRAMVDVSAHCVCYLVNKGSGTGYTVRYAESKGLFVTNTTV